MNNYGYIYLTTNLINNKKYIGQHKSQKFNPNYKGSGIEIVKAFEKYGKENFRVELLEWCDTKEKLNDQEIYYISYYNAINDPNYYNIAKGGFGHSCTAWCKGMTKNTNDILANRSIKMKEMAINNDKLQAAYHLPATNNQKEAVRASRLGVKDSEETLSKKKKKRGKYNYSEESKEKKAQRWTGANNPNINGRTSESRLKESLPMRNRKHIHKLVDGINHNKLVKEEELNNYFQDGWQLGWHYNK